MNLAEKVARCAPELGSERSSGSEPFNQSASLVGGLNQTGWFAGNVASPLESTPKSLPSTTYRGQDQILSYIH
jgi:hypothetical protein